MRTKKISKIITGLDVAFEIELNEYLNNEYVIASGMSVIEVKGNFHYTILVIKYEMIK